MTRNCNISTLGILWLTGSPVSEPLLLTLNAVSAGVLCLFLAGQRCPRRTGRRMR